MPRLADPKSLHPVFRKKHEELDYLLGKVNIPLRCYEGARSPFRQVELYARGRRSPGAKATNARAWESKHQYGIAEDRVFWMNGKWTWDEPEKGMWIEYQRLAKGIGLEVLSFERPHVQLPDKEFPLSHLRHGIYPPGGDIAWEECIEAWIEAWGHGPRDFDGLIHPAAPPSIEIHDRPGLVA